MRRPLPPFTVRPLKRTLVRKSIDQSTMITLARLVSPPSIKASRKPVRATGGRPAPALKVLSRQQLQ
ncbi:MAG: hypothetical protein AB7O43_05065 [Hyphomicrobiaceae bacterium]